MTTKTLYPYLFCEFSSVVCRLLSSVTWYLLAVISKANLSLKKRVDFKKPSPTSQWQLTLKMFLVCVCVGVGVCQTNWQREMRLSSPQR